MNGLYEGTACTELTAGGELDIDFAVGGVLDVLFEVQLHNRIAARCADRVSRGQDHDVFGRGLTGAFFICALCCGFG